MGSPLTPLSNPNTLTAPGDTVTATAWALDWSSVVNYINSSLVASFNVVQNLGDMYVYNGTDILVLSANSGAVGDVLVNRPLASNGLGVDWETPPGIPIDTTGDMLYYNGGNQRLAIGTTGQVLTVAGGLPSWTTSGLPSGLIALWSGSVATIPSGWTLCNGSNGTPNLQGLFVVGAGNSSPAATSGMGLLAPNTQGGDASAGPGLGPSHTHQVTIPTGFGTNNSNAYNDGAGGTYTTTPTSGNGGAVTPQYYALCYIQLL